MNIGDGLLMRTPAYQPLESPLHYILRLSEANGYTTPTVVMALAAPDEDWRVLAKWDCTHLNKVLPACRHTPPTFTYRWPSSSHRCDLSLLGKPMLSRHLNAPHAGICPECVQELGFAPAWWDIRYAVACPTHNRLFVYKCPSCGKRLSHLRRGLSTCSCGASLTVDAMEKPPTTLLWLMALLKEKAEVRSGNSKSRGSERPLRPEDTDLNTLCTILQAVGRAEHRMSGASGAAMSLEAVRRWLPAVTLFLHDWPNGVFQFCSRWRDHLTGQNDRRLGLRSTFAWAFEGLLHNRRKKRRSTLFVIAAVLQYASSELPGLAIDIRARDLRRLPQQDHLYWGVTGAAERSGIPRYTMTRLVRHGRVPYRIAYRGTRVIYEIETKIARKLRLEYQPALMFRQGSRYLGVTHNLFRDLRRHDVLRKTHETMMPKAIAIRDLEEFKQNVLAKSQKIVSVEGLQSLDWLRRKKCPRNAMVRIVEGILQESVQCFHTGTKPQRINDLLVRIADVKAIVTKYSPLPQLTVRQFQVRYELSYHEARTLARYLSGTPSTAYKVRPELLDEKKFDTFATHYVGLTAYARQHGREFWSMLRHLRQTNAKLLELPAARCPGRFVYFVSKQ